MSSASAGEERHVGAGEHREADGVGVLLHDGLDDLLGRLVQAGVDDLHARVAQRAGHDLGAAVVPVEARLGDDHPDAFVRPQLRRGPRPLTLAARPAPRAAVRTTVAAEPPGERGEHGVGQSGEQRGPAPGTVHSRSGETTASRTPVRPAASTVTVIASSAPTAARRGRSDGATTEQRTTAPASSRPPSSARPGRSSSAWGPSRVTTVCMPVEGSVTSSVGDVGRGQRQAQDGDHAEQDSGTGQARADGVERAAVLHDRATPGHRGDDARGDDEARAPRRRAPSRRPPRCRW